MRRTDWGKNRYDVWVICREKCSVRVVDQLASYCEPTNLLDSASTISFKRRLDKNGLGVMTLLSSFFKMLKKVRRCWKSATCWSWGMNGCPFLCSILLLRCGLHRVINKYPRKEDVPCVPGEMTMPASAKSACRVETEGACAVNYTCRTPPSHHDSTGRRFLRPFSCSFRLSWLNLSGKWNCSESSCENASC